jgi:hypothetical protein
LTKEVFLLCWFCFMPARQIGFVRLSSVIPHIPWSRRMFWVFTIRVDLAPQCDRHRLGFTLRVCTYGRWPTVLHAYVSPILVLGGAADGCGLGYAFASACADGCLAHPTKIKSLDQWLDRLFSCWKVCSALGLSALFKRHHYPAKSQKGE